MDLYYHEVSAPARKACVTATYLNTPVNFKRIDLAKGEQQSADYLAINPNGKVPTLRDGDKTIWESNAIMCYLANKAGSDIWPKDERQIDIVRWFCWETAHFSRHASTLIFENAIRSQVGMGEPKQEAIEEAQGFFERFAGVLNDHLKGKDYLVGDALTVADFAVASTLPNAHLGKFSLDGVPEVKRWYAGLSELPAWKEPFPS